MNVSLNIWENITYNNNKGSSSSTDNTTATTTTSSSTNNKMNWNEMKCILFTSIVYRIGLNAFRLCYRAKPINKIYRVISGSSSRHISCVCGCLSVRRQKDIGWLDAHPTICSIYFAIRQTKQCEQIQCIKAVFALSPLNVSLVHCFDRYNCVSICMYWCVCPKALFNLFTYLIFAEYCRRYCSPISFAYILCVFARVSVRAHVIACACAVCTKYSIIFTISWNASI